MLIGLFWIPKSQLHLVQETYQLEKRLQQGFGLSQIEEIDKEKLIPPTKFKSNAFIQPFHEIVVTYGTPCYKEVNPTTFNMVTFPFLFGIMFGDIGHGSILLAFATWLCWRKD